MAARRALCQQREFLKSDPGALGSPTSGSAIDGRTTRHKGYEISQRIRKRVEEIFGWTKTVANFRKTRFRGLERTQMTSYLVGAAYNLLRMARLLIAAAA